MRRPLRAPRAVLFDIGDTLLEERHFDARAGIAAVVPDATAAVDLAREFLAELAARHRERRELPMAAWVRARVPTLARRTVDEIEDAMWGPMATLVPSPGIAQVLQRLAADGVVTAAVSNAAFSSRLLLAELARHGLASSLRFVLTSADIGTMKPDGAIFEEASRRIGVSAADAWFVGDRLDVDVAGAAAAGMQPIWMTSSAAHDGVVTVRDWAGFLALYQGVRGDAPGTAPT